MLRNTSVVEGLEQQLSDAKQQVERAKTAVRLYNNRDFRKLIIEGFCRDDSARFVAQSGDPALSPEQKQDALNLAQAGGHLRRFLSAQVQLGATAERELADLEMELEEARVEADTPADADDANEQD